MNWLIPVALLAAALAGYSVLQVHRQQSGFVLEQAQRIAQEVELDLERRQHGLKSVAALASVAEPGLDSARWYRLARTYDLVFGTPVVLANEDRRILFNTRAPLGDPLADLPKAPGRSAFREALLTGDPQVGDVVFAPVLGKKIITVIVPITKHHALLGLVVLSELEELLERQAMPEGWKVSLFDSAGHLIAHSAGQGPDAQAPSSARRAVMRSSSMPFVVVVEASQGSFYRPHMEASVILLVCVGLAFIGGAYAANTASRGVLASLRRLLARQAPAEAGAPGPDRPGTPRIDEFEAADVELKRQTQNRYQFEESTRAQLAHALQDGLQQDATAAAAHLQVMKSQLYAGGALHQAASVALECVLRIITGISNVVQDLRPASMVAGGLKDALQACTEQFTTLTGIHAEFDIVGDELQVERLPKPVVDGLYRIAQECLSRVRQHAHASLVHIELDVRSPVQVRMTVMDDGPGLSPDDRQPGAGPGLQDMALRVGSLQGSIKTLRGHDQSSTHGTTVVVLLPLMGG